MGRCSDGPMPSRRYRAWPVAAVANPVARQSPGDNRWHIAGRAIQPDVGPPRGRSTRASWASRKGNGGRAPRACPMEACCLGGY
jgi:hypothetical protein